MKPPSFIYPLALILSSCLYLLSGNDLILLLIPVISLSAFRLKTTLAALFVASFFASSIFVVIGSSYLSLGTSLGVISYSFFATMVLIAIGEYIGEK